jgi:2,3-bisphosphoglycerate-dependent phosphoglycerate mutase
MKKKIKEVYSIYLFRHGQTYFNRDGIFSGWKESKLTPLGIEQAQTIASRLKHKRIDIAFQTSLSRSKDTLKEVLKYHPECKRIITDDRIIERDYGDLDGTTHEEFIEEMGEELYKLEVHGDAIFDFNPQLKERIEKILGTQEYKAIHRGYSIRPPNGESFADVEKRVKPFIKDLIKMIKKQKVNVAISAHGNSIRLFRKIMDNTTRERAVKWVIPYDRYFEYQIEI